MKQHIALGIAYSFLVSAVTTLSACSSSSNPAASTSKDSGTSTGGSSAGGSSSSGGSSSASGGTTSASGGTNSGGASSGGTSSASGGTGTGGASSGTGAGCLQKATFVTPAVNAACEEFLSSSDDTQAEGTCNSIQNVTGVTYSWVTACPTGQIGGCKVPPGAKGGAPGGTIRWLYSGNITCASGETQVNADGTPASIPDAGAVVAWNGRVGPGGPISATCYPLISQLTGTAWLKCAGMCPSCNNGAGAPNDQVCLDCVQKDYGAAGCSTDKPFEDLFKLACNDTTFGIAKACAKECGH